jgi:DNA-binding GntR family transcriptional regulator
MSSPKRQLKRSGQTAGQLFDRLIEAILNGDFPSGSVVHEAPLARDWKVSRTPLREAMRRAAESGFIVLRPNQAPIIRPLTAADIRGLYDLREVLEMHALDLAWPHLNDGQLKSLRVLATQAQPRQARDWPGRCLKFDLALHGLWMDRCGNPWLVADLERHYQFLRIFQNWIGLDPRALAASYDDHVAILDALEQREKTEALARLRRHIQASASLVEEALPRTSPPPDETSIEQRLGRKARGSRPERARACAGTSAREQP